MKNSWKLALLSTTITLVGFEGGCGEEPDNCPEVLCLLACPFGSIPDENGCDTCSCLPPPDAVCQALTENACHARTDCTPVYESVPCACAACLPGEGCPPCECDPLPTSYVGCREADPCENLDELSCNTDPACEPVYGWLDCPACFSQNPDDCPICDAVSVYEGCRSIGPCENLDELSCIDAPGCAPRYAEIYCASDPAIAFPCEQGVIYDSCEPDPQPGCSDVLCAIACEDGFVLDAEGCPTCACL